MSKYYDYSADEKVLYVALFDEILFQRYDIDLTNVHKFDPFFGTPYEERWCSERSSCSLYLFETINPIKADAHTRTTADCASFANFLFESDNATMDQQFEKLDELMRKKVVSRAVFSGNKSIHYRITLQNPPKCDRDYKIAWELLRAKYFSDVTVDMTTNTPAHLTRAPGQFRNNAMYEQTLLFLSSHTVNLDWKKERDKILIKEAKAKIRKINALERKLYYNNFAKKNLNSEYTKEYKHEYKEYAEFFEEGRTDDNYKHENLRFAVSYWRANPQRYTRVDVEQILSPYKTIVDKDFYEWGMRMYDH